MKPISPDSLAGRVLTDLPVVGFDGSLLTDINGYFFEDELRSTHDGMLEGMPSELRHSPYFADTRPALRFLPHEQQKLWGGLRRATLGAFGTYVEDVYLGGPHQTSIEERRRTAIFSGRVMGMLAAVGDTVNGATAYRTPQAVGDFYRNMGDVLTGETPRPAPDPRLNQKPQLIALGLARFVHTKHLASNPQLAANVQWDLDSMANTTNIQMTARRTVVGGWDTLRARLLIVAGLIGRATGSMILRQTECAYPDSQDLGRRGLVLANAEQGGYWHHGRGIIGALRSRVATFPIPVLYKHGGPTSEALREIKELTHNAVADARRRAEAELQPDNHGQRGRSDMMQLLTRAEAVATLRRGSRREIDRIMHEDPYWKAYGAA